MIFKFSDMMCVKLYVCAFQEIDVGKDFSIPRPQTTNYRELYE